jgi:hypothetical protein
MDEAPAWRCQHHHPRRLRPGPDCRRSDGDRQGDEMPDACDHPSQPPCASAGGRRTAHCLWPHVCSSFEVRCQRLRAGASPIASVGESRTPLRVALGQGLAQGRSGSQSVTKNPTPSGAQALAADHGARVSAQPRPLEYDRSVLTQAVCPRRIALSKIVMSREPGQARSTF